MLNSIEHVSSTTHKNYQQMKRILALSLSDVEFIMLVNVKMMLVNVKMPTIVGILTFISKINFMLSRVEHDTNFITPGRQDPIHM